MSASDTQLVEPLSLVKAPSSPLYDFSKVSLIWMLVFFLLSENLGCAFFESIFFSSLSPVLVSLLDLCLCLSMPLPRAPRLPGLKPFYDSRCSNIFAAFSKLVVRTFRTLYDAFTTFTASATPLPATFTTPLRPLRRLYNLRMLLCEAKFAMVEAYTLADEVETMVHLTTLHYDSSCMMPLAFCLGKL